MIVLVILYLGLTLLSLTALPVFSDEAIYIRWSQVAMRVPEKYAFLPMLDGKPPLHAWLMAPFLRVIQDPLFAGRLFSVLTGLLTMLILPNIVRLLGGSKKAQLLSAVLATILPYFYFHNRMALAESLLGCLFAFCLYSALQIYKTKKWRYGVVFALALGASLWTKTNALFFIPVFAMLPILVWSMHKGKRNLETCKSVYLSAETRMLVLSGIGGGVLFGLLALSPLFPSLFNRSADYTFSISQLLSGEWRYVLFTSIPNILYWIVWYLSPFVILLCMFGGRKNAALSMMALGYFMPLALLGRVLSARYFFPVAIVMVVMAALGFDGLSKSRALIAKLLMLAAVLYSAVFMWLSVANPAQIPFTLKDREQYLTAWSSGYGIPQVVAYVTEQAKQKSHITVVTEGYFGTLPDGLQIYFDRSTVANNIEIHGIGEPITAFPAELFVLATTEDVYVVVNEHRLKVADTQSYEIVQSYPRPFNAPPLLLLKLHPLKVGQE